jgi:hypothetical protein
MRNRISIFSRFESTLCSDIKKLKKLPLKITKITIVHEPMLDAVYRTWTGSGPRSRRTKYDPQKNLKISCYEVLDILFWGLKATSVAWTSFMEA